MSDFSYTLTSSSAEAIQGTFASSREQKVEELLVSSIIEVLQQSTAEVPSSPLSDVVEMAIALAPIEEHSKEIMRTIKEMEDNGIFQDADGDGIPDYHDVTGSESRFEQEAANGTTGAMESLRAMISSILGFNFSLNGPKSLEIDEISKIQGGNLQTTMAATHKDRITTHFDVGASMRGTTVQKFRTLVRKIRQLKALDHVENFYKSTPEISNRSRMGDGMPRRT